MRPLISRLAAGLVAASAVLAPAPALADAVTVKGVRYDPQTQTLVISGDAELHPKVTHLERPDRLVIDLPGAHLAANFRPLMGIPGTSVRRIRIGQYLANTTRVVLDLTQGAEYQATTSGQDVLIAIPGGKVAVQTPQLPVKPPVGLVPLVGSQLQAIAFNKTDLSFTLSRLTPYWTHAIPGSPFRYEVVFPRTRVAPELLGADHPVNAAGILSYRATQVGADAHVELALLRAPHFEVAAAAGAWHFYTEHPKVAVAPSPTPKPVAAVASAKPTAPRPSGPAPTWVGAPDAPLALRKVGDQWQLLITADKQLGFKAQAVGDDRLRVDLAGGHVALPRDSVYIDGGLIARVRVTPGAAGNTRLTIDLDQPVRHTARLMPNQRSLLITLGKLGSRRVTVDPGHGGSDTGTIGQRGTREKDVTLAIGTKLAALMRANGISVQMTRMKDLEVLLRPRVEMSNHNDSDVFISIHANSFGNQHGVEGIETYYFSDESYGLAKAIHRQLLLQLKQPDRGVRKNNFYVVHHTQMPAALVEIGYLSNAHEEALLSTPAYQDKAAKAIYAGIKDFLAERKAKP